MPKSSQPPHRSSKPDDRCCRPAETTASSKPERDDALIIGSTVWLLLLCSRYGDFGDDGGAGSRQPSASRGRLGTGGRNRVQFARGSRLGLGQGGVSRSATRGTSSGQSQDQENPQDYMSKAKQLWNYVGKVRLCGLRGCSLTVSAVLVYENLYP